jgi:hypothetical protein
MFYFTFLVFYYGIRLNFTYTVLITALTQVPSIESVYYYTLQVILMLL